MFNKSLVCVIVVLFFGAGVVSCVGFGVYPPDKPIIYGPDNGVVNVEYTFCTGPITDPYGDSLYCLWNWGDESSSDWLGPYFSGETICASHAWSQPGVYCIILKLRDTHGMENESDPFCITIVENHRPDAPTIDGPTRVKAGVEYTWSFNSTDPDGDNITYYVDWGDVCGGAEWHGPYPPGQEVFLTHTYTSKNTLIINSMAVDEYGAESNMTYFEVIIPRSISFDSIFMRLLERFPNMFPFLRFLLKL